MTDTPKKEKKQKYRFSSVLLIADKVTAFNRVYNRELCEKIVERLNQRPYIVIQEMNLVERKLKKINEDVVWKEKVMATIRSATMLDNKLVFEAECRLSRDGKVLSGMVQSLGLAEIEFVPVGRGIPDSNGVIGLDYELIYVAVEPDGK